MRIAIPLSRKPRRYYMINWDAYEMGIPIFVIMVSLHRYGCMFQLQSAIGMSHRPVK